MYTAMKQVTLTWLRPREELYELWIGFLLEPGVPLGVWTPLPELMEEVRDLFIMASSASEVIPLFRLPGLEEGRESIWTYICYSHTILHVVLWVSTAVSKTQRQRFNSLRDKLWGCSIGQKRLKSRVCTSTAVITPRANEKGLQTWIIVQFTECMKQVLRGTLSFNWNVWNWALLDRWRRQ